MRLLEFLLNHFHFDNSSAELVEWKFVDSSALDFEPKLNGRSLKLEG